MHIYIHTYSYPSLYCNATTITKFFLIWFINVRTALLPYAKIDIHYFSYFSGLKLQVFYFHNIVSRILNKAWQSNPCPVVLIRMALGSSASVASSGGSSTALFACQRSEVFTGGLKGRAQVGQSTRTLTWDPSKGHSCSWTSYMSVLRGPRKNIPKFGFGIFILVFAFYQQIIILSLLFLWYMHFGL